MTHSELRRAVRSLQRRLALPLAVIRARRAVEDVCDKWGVAQIEKTPLPAPHEVVTMVANAGFRHGESGALRNYIERCQNRGDNPDPSDMVRALLPRANKLGLVYQCFRWDCPPPPDPVLSPNPPMDGARAVEGG